MAAMKLSCSLPTNGWAASAEAMEALVTRAERLGFHAVFFSDHLIYPVETRSEHPYSFVPFQGEGDILDLLSLLAFVGAKTDRLRLVASVMIVPNRNPVLTAKALATIDVLSKGRLTVGVGVGWLREETAAVGFEDFDRRGAATDEYISMFKDLWTEDPSEFHGEFYSYPALHCLPKPVQKPHPPIWIGGHSKAALRRTARHGDGWHPIAANPKVPLPPAELQEKMELLRRYCESEGREISSLAVSMKTGPFTPGPPPAGETRRLLTGSPDEIVADIAAYEAVGVQEIAFGFGGAGLDEALASMDEFAATIMRKMEA
jgi:probable F420-dependent oxidoreductase